jgi:hypothetical protein
MAMRFGPVSCVGIGYGVAFVNQRPILNDSRPVPVSPQPQLQRQKSSISPKTVQQLASGSITGSLALAPRRLTSASVTLSTVDTLSQVSVPGSSCHSFRASSSSSEASLLFHFM